MKRSGLTALVISIGILFFLSSLHSTVYADSLALPTPETTQAIAPQTPQFLRGRIIQVVKDDMIAEQPEHLYVQELQVQLQGVTDPVEISLGSNTNPISQEQRLSINQEVIVVKQSVADKDYYQIVEVYRLHYIGYLIAGFFLLVLIINRRKGIGAIVGLIVSAAVIVYVIVPQILAGTSAILITIIGGVIIMTVSLYLAHGFNRQTTIAVFSTGVTLATVGFFSALIVTLFRLTGMGTDEALFLQMGVDTDISLQGLLLSGIMIGTLGVLDDITTSQTAIVYELHRTDPKLSSQELYNRALNVGREHISSLVNTLILAYAGASLPLFMLFSNNTYYPLWVSLNFEFIIEEIVRTVLASIGLIIAVPITTFIAAYNLVPQTPGRSNINQRHNH
ncbi:YibE/F family protein [candidate division WWE3 bacterium]|nr:YibE/F family protein [candidate division WWE3 bacterium]